MTRLLRNSKDWISLAHVGFVIGTLLFGYYLTTLHNPWAWLLAVIAVLAGIYTNYVAHNHSHKGLFEVPWLNRLMDHVLGFTSGTPLLFWRLHHVENHHRYEGTQKDWSWNFNFQGCEFPDKPIPWWYYSITFTPIVLCSVTLHILRRPFSKVFWDSFSSLAVLFAINAVLFAISPLYWLLTNGAIYLSAPFFLGFANYFHHYACPDRRGVRAANSFIHPFHNAMSYNIGFHIEHSMRPQMHWSELPAFYEEHKDQIPQEHVVTDFFPGAGDFNEIGKWLKKRAAEANYTGHTPQASEWHHPEGVSTPAE